MKQYGRLPIVSPRGDGQEGSGVAEGRLRVGVKRAEAKRCSGLGYPGGDAGREPGEAERGAGCEGDLNL